MPTQDYDGPISMPSEAVEQSSIACPPSLTPPPEHVDLSLPTRPTNPLEPDFQPPDLERASAMYVDNNTGTSIATSQEECMYMSPDASPDPNLHVAMRHAADDREKMDMVQDENTPSKAGSIIEALDTSLSNVPMMPISPRSLSPASPILGGIDEDPTTEPDDVSHLAVHSELRCAQSAQRNAVLDTTHLSAATRSKRNRELRGGAKVDKELDWDTTTSSWDFTEKLLTPKYPSSLFQCDSRYAGTQQSDRQIYNVYVRILTVDMEQCSCTGYLTIKGLTPEHETLQTYFTGEIIGGPGKRYGFRTKTSQWGASDKTDLTHWARFAAWRSHAAHTKKNLDFPFPPMGESWWQQENIFMRWKEHFLVPDHKTKSIAGASFEGFYYICLNQVEGKISGIYFHSKSEKYQQLELRHEGSPGIWHRGVTPCVEFR